MSTSTACKSRSRLSPEERAVIDKARAAIRRAIDIDKPPARLLIACHLFAALTRELRPADRRTP
jgi:hypothetical protein